MGKKLNIPEKQESPADKITGKYHYAIGRRKSAIATVRLHPKGSGKIFINGMEFETYFPIDSQRLAITAPLTVSSNDGKFDITIHVKGGGKAGQADAIRLGIARALLLWQSELRPIIKSHGFLTRDSRVKERKKPGLKRARRAPQFSKR